VIEDRPCERREAERSEDHTEANGLQVPRRKKVRGGRERDHTEDTGPDEE